jgi:hypothetical protein
MHTSDLILSMTLIGCIWAAPTTAMSQSSECVMIEETDPEFGSIARHLRTVAPQSAGTAVCTLHWYGETERVPFVVTRMSVTESIRSFRLESLYLYRNQLSAITQFPKDLLGETMDPQVQFICLVRESCVDFFDEGFVITSEEIPSSEYQALVDIWLKADVEEQIFHFDGHSRSETRRMRGFIEDGSVLRPSGIDLRRNDGRIDVVYLWVYALATDGSGDDWMIQLKMEKGSPVIFDVFHGLE